MIIPVPLHLIRERERGYNQSYLLAKALSKAFEIPASERILKRVRSTPPQWPLTEAQRRENLNSAFRAVSAFARGKRILLVDDLYTTGATLRHCALALKKGGALGVDGLTLARAYPS